ncbi:O-acetyl-ADP-ribose deacetylase 1 isoform X1 [Oopsacas minuta]|uniref:O-acetyl-ADP-ribose deacetylase 1 isoform X1 n=1 Tax=Oopsacas minuta TaxID=111878 RepID=A0AAV7KDU1_9METZ|nr:O-acetyl-ADP-ribose deacetylase 1 isoform X1 [Oopsacas minuta]
MAEKNIPIDPCKDSILTERVGDLFSCPATASMGHCVSRDLHMGKGIAVIFKKKFGGVAALKAQNKEIGECSVLLDNSRYIYYLITKEKYNYKPKLASLRQAVCAMRDHCVLNDVKELCLPKIGCGLDRLVWKDVKQILIDTFKETNIQLSVYSLS